MRCCYSTLITKDFYLFGVLGLYFSILKNNSKYPLVVLADENLSLKTFNTFKEYNITYKKIKSYCFKEDDKDWIYNDTINKFQTFLLTEYDKIFFIDADCIVNKNIDFIFNTEKDYLLSVIQNKNSHRIHGGYFLITPEKNTFNYILENKQNFTTDEQVIENLLHPDYLTDINHHINLELFITHDGGFPKYWEFINNENLLLEFIQNNFLRQQFFFNFWDKKRRSNNL